MVIFLWILGIFVLIVLVALAAIVVYDVNQRKHAILHNYPVLGHLRYLLEKIGPELRQYIVTNNDEERPFSRDQRRWIYASSKKENNYFGFGTDNDLELSPNYLILKHSPFPVQTKPKDHYPIPCSKILGEFRNREQAFRPKSIIYTSAMSFGSLGSAAIEAINIGCGLSDSLQNTGEGGISKYHCSGGELILQLGTAYFGARDQDGNFCMEKLVETVQANPHIRAIEVKLSQGAKPGLGGLLPAGKITEEISKARGIPMGKDCISPSAHREFHDVDSMLDFIEKIAKETGRPVGIKSAVGDATFWKELAEQIKSTNRAPDYIAIDGGEGGTGAAPLSYSDHVSLPFKIAFTRVYQEFTTRRLHEKIVFAGAGRIGMPVEALFASALGCDMIGVAREAMLSIGCIQAQRCHTAHCPAGVATNIPWLMKGLDPTLKGARLANYITMLRCEMLKLCHTAGVEHPALIRPEHFEILDGQFGSDAIAEKFGISNTEISQSHSEMVAGLMR